MHTHPLCVLDLKRFVGGIVFGEPIQQNNSMSDQLLILSSPATTVHMPILTGKIPELTG